MEGDSGKVVVSLIIPFFLIGVPAGLIAFIIDYFDKGFEHCEEYNRIYNEEEYQYTSPLVASLPHIVKGELAPMGDDFWEKQLRHYRQTIIEELRRNPKYSICFK